jgi:hypothetical protein
VRRQRQLQIAFAERRIAQGKLQGCKIFGVYGQFQIERFAPEIVGEFILLSVLGCIPMELPPEQRACLSPG